MKSNFTAGNVLLRKVQGKENYKSKRYRKSQVSRQITVVFWSKGLKAKASKLRKGGNSFANILASTFAGKQLDVKIGLRRLSQAQLNYAWTITQAGGIFLLIASAMDFEEWCHETFKIL
jgi:hypothetical protein